MKRFATFELAQYPHRARLMAGFAFAALAIDFAAKLLAIKLKPSTLLYNVSADRPFGVGAPLIFVLVCTSLLACVLPARFVAVGSGIALGGAAGNLASRYWSSAHGGSPDFIVFPDGSTGNTADLFIGLGTTMMLIATVVWLGKAAVRSRRREARSPG